MILRRKRYAILGIIAVSFCVVVADFHRWVSEVGRLETPEHPEADAIVALTGGSGKRIAAAIQLLKDDDGDRLLISGVHESVSVATLRETAGGSEALYDCCIDIGRQASSTKGNAIETGDWARAHGYKTVILVTSDYHMPRALMWFDHVTPDLQLVVYPMQSSIQPETWWRSWKSFRGLVTEWAKYRVTAVLLAF